MSLAVIPMILAVLFLLARYPYALAVLALFLPTEAPGTGAVIAGTYRMAVPLIYGGYFLAIFKTLHMLWVRRNTSLASRRILTVALLAAGTSGWIAFSMFSHDANKIETIYTSLGALPGAIFALAYYNDRTARIVLIAAVAIHLIIGCGVIAFPHSPLALLRQTTSAGAALPDVWSMETTAYKDSAQFGSAAQLAFYAAMGLIVGLSILFYHRRTLIRVIGVCLAGLGVAATFFTLERGIWIGLFIGLLVLVAPLRRKPVGKLVCGTIIFAMALGVLAVCMSRDNLVLVALRDHFLAVRGDAYRIPVAVRSLDVLIMKPLFGVGGQLLDLIDLVGGAPHQSFYFYAVTYGIPAGVCVAAMTWLSLATSFTKRRPPLGSGLTQYDRLLGRTLGLVVVAMALTNGMSGGMLGWMCLGFACLPWAYGRREARGMRHEVMSGESLRRQRV